MGIAVRAGPISSVICTRHPDCSEDLEHFTLSEHTLDAFPDISVQGTVIFTIIEGFKLHLGQFYRVFRPRYVIYFAISEISDTFAILNQKVYPSRASLRT